MSGSRIYFMILGVISALIGLFGAAVAKDFGFTLFSWALLAFGVLFALGQVKAHFDAAERH